MSLESLAKIGKLKQHNASREDAVKLLAAARRNRAEIRIKGLSPETRFDLAYKAIMQCGLLAIMAHGYRPSTNEPGHHATVIQTLPVTIGVENAPGSIRTERTGSNKPITHRAGVGPLDPTARTSDALLTGDDASHRLGTSGEGGSKAYRALTELARLATIANQQTQPRGNYLTITLTNDVETLLTHNPCVVQLPFDEAVHAANLARMADCTKIYLVASEFLTYSDSRRYRKYIEDAQILHKHVSLILHNVSDRVLEHYKAEFPGVEVVCWDGEV